MTREELQIALNAALAPVHAELTPIRAGLADLAATVEALDSRLEALDSKVEALDSKVGRGLDRLGHRLAIVESRLEELGGHYALQVRSIIRLECELTDALRRQSAS